MINNAAHFVFDSEHVSDIQTKLYGFYATSEGMFVQTPSDSEDISDAYGAWVLVRRTSDGIEITQDAIGCFGLFLYRDGNYWAISNSFNHLLDFLKGSHTLSLNREYVNAYLAQHLCISLYGNTIINEIAWLDRRARIVINSFDLTLSIELRKLEEHTIPVDTEEGLHILDSWHNKWAAFTQRAVVSWPGKIQVDISGGFDTRVNLPFILSSGIPLDRIFFYSNKKLEEDYRIAALLADKYGFVLNKPSASISSALIPSVERYSDIALANIYFEKEIYARPAAGHIPTLVFRGNGGEVVRGYQEDFTGSRLINSLYLKAVARSLDERGLVEREIEEMLSRNIKEVETVLKRADQKNSEKPINGAQYYMETRCRTHFGMDIARGCLSHRYIIAPVLDPLLLKLQTPSDSKHPLLICALLYSRYKEDLCTIPFEVGKSIPAKTLQLAKKLNTLYPRKEFVSSSSYEPASTHMWRTLQTDVDKEQNPVIQNDSISTGDSVFIGDSLLEAFCSPLVQDPVRELYAHRKGDWLNIRDERHPNINKYAAAAIAKAIEDVKLGKKAHVDMASFIETARTNMVYRDDEYKAGTIDLKHKIFVSLRRTKRKFLRLMQSLQQDVRKR